MYAVVRVRGTVGRSKKIKLAMDSLNLTKPNHCVMIPENDVNKGILQKVKDYVTWGEISEEKTKELKTNRGNKNSKVFRLSPPRKGFERKGIKQAFTQGGALGYRGEKINDLLGKMI